MLILCRSSVLAMICMANPRESSEGTAEETCFQFHSWAKSVVACPSGGSLDHLARQIDRLRKMTKFKDDLRSAMMNERGNGSDREAGSALAEHVADA